MARTAATAAAGTRALGCGKTSPSSFGGMSPVICTITSAPTVSIGARIGGRKRRQQHGGQHSNREAQDGDERPAAAKGKFAPNVTKNGHSRSLSKANAKRPP